MTETVSRTLRLKWAAALYALLATFGFVVLALAEAARTGLPGLAGDLVGATLASVVLIVIVIGVFVIAMEVVHVPE